MRRIGWILCAVTLAEYAGNVALGGMSSAASGAGSFVAIMSCAVVGALILHRFPGHRIGWILCVAPLFIGLAAVSGAYSDASTGHGAVRTVAAWASQWSWMAGLALPVMLLGLLIPDGRLPSSRWRPVLWLACLQYTLAVSGAMFAPGVLDKKWGIENPVGITGAQYLLAGGLIAVPPILAATVAAAMLRFRRGSVVERQQLKWIVTAFAGAVVFGVANGIVSFVHPSYHGAPEALVWLTWATIPIAFGVAILRYRLYEIDVIVRRTLVYAALLLVLGAIYLAGVAAIGATLRSLTGQSGAFAVTLSTLAVAAGFQPARARIQRAVDRRFARDRYDAERALAALAHRLREGVELEAISGDVIGVVTETVRPRHATLWLRPHEETTG